MPPDLETSVYGASGRNSVIRSQYMCQSGEFDPAVAINIFQLLPITDMATR
ncbi:MAG: hypothetical protein AB7T07_11005 [Steroidobacteraceae bacterium]